MCSAIFLRITPIFSMRTLSPGAKAGAGAVIGGGVLDGGVIGGAAIGGTIDGAVIGGAVIGGAAIDGGVVAAGPFVDAGAEAAAPLSTNARMSFLVTRPEIPVPARAVMSTPCAFAIVRTRGEDRVRRRSARVTGRAGVSPDAGSAAAANGTGEAGAPCVAVAAGAGAGAPADRSIGRSPAAPITATTLFTGTVSPSFTLISSRTPAPGAGISASTLSVEISKSGSSLSIGSPTLLIQRTMVPSAIDSPIWGITTSVAMIRTPRLRVNRSAVRRVCCLAHCLGHRRMRVNRPNQFLDGRLEPQGDSRLRDELGGARTNQVHAEQLIVLRLGDNLHEALRFAGDSRAAEHAEREQAGADIVAALHRLGFGQSDAADLRLAVCTRRHLVVVEGPRLPTRDPLGEHDALGR